MCISISSAKGWCQGNLLKHEAHCVFRVAYAGLTDAIYTTLAIPRPDDRRTRADLRAVDLDGFFSMHPALAPLLPAWQDRRLGFVHACGALDTDSLLNFKPETLNPKLSECLRRRIDYGRNTDRFARNSMT